MADVIQILKAVEQGDPHAAAQLLPLVYDELRQLAAQRLAQEKPGQTLQATALVHEAHRRLAGECDKQHWYMLRPSNKPQREPLGKKGHPAALDWGTEIDLSFSRQVAALADPDKTRRLIRKPPRSGLRLLWTCCPLCVA